VTPFNILCGFQIVKMQGPFARPIGLARKATLDGIAGHTQLLSAVLGEPVTCGRTVPYNDKRPESIPAGNYCVSAANDEPPQFVLATRLVFTKADGEVAADYRSIVLGDLSGAKRGADVITVYDHGMDIEHNRRAAVIFTTDVESHGVLMASTLFPAAGTFVLL
jgi:hypothetical protein